MKTPSKTHQSRFFKPWILLAPLLLLLSGCGINNIPTYDESVTAAWAQVENQYKRRADLIPNLVETVRGFAKQEKDVLIGVIEARSKVSQMKIPKDILTNPQAMKAFQANQGALGSALSKLMVVVERYPQLTSGQNFQSLQAQLEGTENRISVARRDFINAVRIYNTEIRTFPGRLWASWLYPEAEPKQSFSAPEAAKEVPSVKF